MKRLSLCLLMLACGAAWAQLATRAEVLAQREAIEGQFAREKAECEQRFAVSACLEDLRQRQRAALAPIVAREHELAAEERRARAAAQAQRVKEREQAASAVPVDGQRRERLTGVAPAVAASHAPRARSPELAAQVQRAAEQKAQAEAARRREQARAREALQQKRLADHAAREQRRTKPAAAPLPLPSASAASR